MPSRETTSSTIMRNVTQHGGRAAVSAVALSYGAGLLITNIHVVSFGFTIPDLVQPRYVLVGMLWLFLIASLTCIWTITVRTTTSVMLRTDLSPGRRFIIWSVVTALGFLLSFCLTQLITAQQLRPRETARLITIVCIGVGLATPLVRMIGARLVRAAGGSRADSSAATPLAGATIAAFYVLAMIVGGIWLYAKHIYPAIPPALGGGANGMISLVATPEGAARLREAGVPFRRGLTTAPLRIIHETGSSYLVTYDAFGRRQNAAIARTLVEVALYASHEPRAK